jgi:hypothetical protein
VDAVTIEVRPATSFPDVAAVLGPKKSPDGNVCWCLSHRVDSATNRSLAGRERGNYVRRLVSAGFTKVADTGSVSGGFPRVVMRLPLD